MVPPKFPTGLGKANLFGDLLKESLRTLSSHNCPHCKRDDEIEAQGWVVSGSGEIQTQAVWL